MRLSLPALAIAASILAGCQSGSSPLTPAPAAVPQTPTAPPATAVALPADLGLLGAFQLTVDPGTLEVVAEPLRLPTAYGDNYWLNATGFLDGAPCRDCFGIRGVSRDLDNHVIVTVNARHPFAPGNPGLPISATNRLDLHVFDASVMAASDLGNTIAAFTGGSETIPARLVLNADGHSPLLTSVVQQLQPGLAATAYPYVMLNEDPTIGTFSAANPNGFADTTQPAGHNVFPMGADVSADLVLGLEPTDGPLSLGLYFTCA